MGSIPFLYTNKRDTCWVSLLLVPLTGIEPVRILLRGILSPLCLPIPPFGVPDLFLAGRAAASAIDPGTRCALADSATGSARACGHSGVYKITVIVGRGLAPAAQKATATVTAGVNLRPTDKP